MKTHDLKYNTLYCGDCLEVMQAWPNACVDLIYLDPLTGKPFQGELPAEKAQIHIALRY